ncbi:MAG: Panacea domain-containing protein [Xanthobacteraceae bacterium]
MQRVAAAVHYVIAKADSGQLGYVKLNKVLWYSDLEHYRSHGVSITGLKHYTRTQVGPMSKEISRAVGRLVKERKVAERTVQVTDYSRREMISLEQPDFSVLIAEQIGILNRMIDIIAPLTASQLSQMTSDDRLWLELKNQEAMPIGTGSIITRLPGDAVTYLGDRQSVEIDPYRPN